MTTNQLQNIEELEASLWDAADNLRANSKLTAGEYCMPVLGVIFLRHATNRYAEALREIQVEQAAGKIPKRPLTSADFKKRRALLLPKEARYDELLKLSSLEGDAQKRMAMLKEAETILLDELPVLPVYWYVHTYLLRPEVKGWRSSVLEHRCYKALSLGAADAPMH